MQLTIGIKALNEQLHIADAIQSALEAAKPFSGEVILADCGSTDQTLAIARGFPIRIVQLADTSRPSCGAGAQLAYQHSAGDYFYLLDGDMVLDAEFLPPAMACLEQDANIAAVGGQVREMNATSLEFQIRAKTFATGRTYIPGIVNRLDGGGLYRTSAIREVGYFADQNLHGFEEFELGARLQSKGWKLARIEKQAVNHYGYQMNGYKLLWRKIRSGNANACGELLRSAIGRDHFFFVMRHLGHVRFGMAVIVWWGLICLAAITPSINLEIRSFLLLLLVAGPIAVLAFRRKSLKLGLYSFCGWNVNAVGIIRGFLHKRESPVGLVPSVSLKE